MDKKCLIGEVLFIICNYDKGKTQKNIWSKKFYKKLMTDIYFCRNFLEILLGLPVDINYILFHFVELENEKLGRGIFTKEYEKIESTLKEGNISLSDEEAELCSIMLNEILKIELLLIEKPENHKIIINNSFKSIHNIPKVFINNENNLFTGFVGCSSETALESYQFWNGKNSG